MPSWTLRVAAVLTCLVIAPVPTQAGAPGPQETPRELVEKIKDQKERSPGAWFETLGARRDAAGLKALEQALGLVKSEAKLSEVARALRHFAGEASLEARALQVLRGLALDKKAAEARAGVSGLSAFGAPALATLRQVTLQIEDEVARGRGLRPLLPALAEKPDADGLGLVLGAWRTPESGTHARGVEVLQAFRTPAFLGQMGRLVSDEAAPRLRRELVLSAVGAMKLDGEALEAADEVVDRGLAAKDSAVQFRALEAVVTRGRALRKQPLESLTKAQADELRRLAHVALARLELAEDGAAPKAVMALARSKDPSARQAAALELARRGTEDAVAELVQLLADPDPRVRSEAIRAVAARRRASSVVALIDRLDLDTGKHAQELYWALRMLTGQDHGPKSPRWRLWWNAEGRTFELPTLAEAEEADRVRTERRQENSSQATFYGLQVFSTRMAFVVDVSGSMSAQAYSGKTRLDVAKAELAKVVANLQGDAYFNILAFSTGVDDWQKATAVANEKNRESAQAFIERLRAGGGTAIYDGLMSAFEDPTIDTIYLMTDGDPSGGIVSDPALIQSEVARVNSSRHVTIHCIAVGQDRPLLQGLAADTGGLYKRID